MFDSNSQEVNPEPEAANRAPVEGAPAPEGTEEIREPTDADEALRILNEASEALDPSKLDAGRIARAIFLLKNSNLTLPGRKLWDIAPTSVQRNMAFANQSEVGAWFMSYFPTLNPKAYFLPGHALALFALSGALEFKLTAEEEKQREAELGENPTPAAITEWNHRKQEEIRATITLAGEGLGEMVTSKPARNLAAESPELAPVVVAGEVSKRVVAERASFLEKLRSEVHALEMEAAGGESVGETAHDTKEEAAYSVNPQAHLHPDAANSPFPDEERKAV